MVRQFLHKQGQRLRQQGQALIEFALASTLIFLLLSAAVDLGLIFFTLQGLHNAAQEGANYGSRWMLDNPSTGNRSLDEDAIRDRVRLESGDRGGIGFVNLLDLNSNNVPDVSPNTAHVGDDGATYEYLADGTTRVIDDYIQIRTRIDANRDGIPEDASCSDADLANPRKLCFIEIAVSIDYNLVFGLSPAFGEQRRITSRYVLYMRNTDTMVGNSQTPALFKTAIPVPTSTVMRPTETSEPTSIPSGPVIVEINDVPTSLSRREGSKLEIGAVAYDTRSGTSDGSGIASVSFEVYTPDRTLLLEITDTEAPFCAYGGSSSCSPMSSSDWDTIKEEPGSYTIKAYAISSIDGLRSETSVYFVIR